MIVRQPEDVLITLPVRRTDGDDDGDEGDIPRPDPEPSTEIGVRSR